jgi:hypothetical protein
MSYIGFIQEFNSSFKGSRFEQLNPSHSAAAGITPWRLKPTPLIFSRYWHAKICYQVFERFIENDRARGATRNELKLSLFHTSTAITFHLGPLDLIRCAGVSKACRYWCRLSDYSQYVYALLRYYSLSVLCHQSCFIHFSFELTTMRHFHHHKALRAAHGDDGF